MSEQAQDGQQPKREAHDGDRGPKITPEWLRRNNSVAARVHRGASTAATRLEVAAEQYERASRSLAVHALGQEKGALEEHDPAHRLAEGYLLINPRGGAYAVDADAQDIRGRSLPRYALIWGPLHEDAMGASRVHERAIYEARFGVHNGMPQGSEYWRALDRYNRLPDRPAVRPRDWWMAEGVL